MSTGFTDKKSSASLKPDLYTLSRIDSAKTRDDLIKWSGKDSIIFSKDKTIIYLYGQAKIICNAFSITADEIIFNKNTNKVFAKNFTILFEGTDSPKTGTFGEFSLQKMKSR